MNKEKIALARKMARSDIPEEVAEMISWLVNAYRSRCVALEHLTQKINDF